MAINSVVGKIVLQAVFLFAVAEALHKAMLLFDIYIDLAHWFAVLSRSAIYVYIAFQAQLEKLKAPKSFLLFVCINIYEYVVLGLISMFVFFLVKENFDIFNAVIGVLVSYPIALILAIAIFSLAYVLFGWLRFTKERVH